MLPLLVTLLACTGDTKEDTAPPVAPEDDCAAEDATGWYYDGDGDGYGNAGATVTACDAPAGYVADASDCNDGDALASPVGFESCDGADNDCDGTVDEDGPTPWYPDGDGDGYGRATDSVTACGAPTGHVVLSTDCDDGAVAIHPGAAEVCDGVDNDCDATVDEAGGATFYADADGDGYGDAGVVTTGCAVPAGYVVDAADCDDAAAGTSPAATEVCDGLDNNCDGAVDDSGGALAYADTDGDGHGDPATSTTSCELPPGYVASSDDCDDGDATFSPSASETCDDGLDQDCDGAADDACPATVTHCGTIAADETWSGTDVHEVTCDVYVQGASAPLLTIEDGAVVTFAPGVGLYVGYGSYGELWIDGTTDGVVLTSSDARRPGPGDWEGLTFGGYDRGSWLEGATIEYGGDNGYGNVLVTGTSTVTLVDSAVRESSHAGVYVSGSGAVAISGTTVADNDAHGIYLNWTAALDDATLPSLSGNTITGNDGYPLVTPAASVKDIEGTNTFVGNTSDAVYVYSSTVTEDSTWAGLDVPYYLVGDVTFGGATPLTLTIEDGAELQFAPGAGLSIGYTGYVDLLVDGHTEGVRFTSAERTPGPGDWDGLFLGGSASGTIDGATIAYAGGNGVAALYLFYTGDEGNPLRITDSVIEESSTYGVYVSQEAGLEIDRSVVRDNADYGLYVHDTGTLAGDGSCSGNTFTANDVGVSVSAGQGGSFVDDGAYTGNRSDDVILRAEEVHEDFTLQALDSGYRVTGYITVADPTTRPHLVIEDGTELRFDPDAGIGIGTELYGSLDVQGTALGVTFTSSQPTPAPGDWYGLTFGGWNQASTIRGATVEYAGQNGYGNVYSWSYYGGSLLIDACTITDGSQSGVYVTTNVYDVTVTDSTLSDNADHGLYVAASAGLETTGAPTFTGNTVTGNGLNPVVVPASSADQLDSSSTYTGNGDDRIYLLYGTVASTTTWQELGLPWKVGGNILVQGTASPTLTIEPGSRLEFEVNTRLTTGAWEPGKLYAIGTASAPIVFTSADTVPAIGDWDGLVLHSYDTGTLLQNVEVSYGGGSDGNVYIYGNGPRVAIVDSVVSNSSRWGVCPTGGATPTLSGVTYSGNTYGNVYY
ncbi:MAG: MopE-related protein [Myxococcota bacterium]